jgi:hypothetical protein
LQRKAQETGTEISGGKLNETEFDIDRKLKLKSTVQN